MPTGVYTANILPGFLLEIQSIQDVKACQFGTRSFFAFSDFVLVFLIDRLIDYIFQHVLFVLF